MERGPINETWFQAHTSIVSELLCSPSNPKIPPFSIGSYDILLKTSVRASFLAFRFSLSFNMFEIIVNTKCVIIVTKSLDCK